LVNADEPVRLGGELNFARRPSSLVFHSDAIQPASSSLWSAG
jgi:hypothetical protein